MKNKKVDEEFKGINDVYVLQCMCTELKELCDKYEEEHNTTFKEWQKDIQANKKAVEILERDYHIKGEDRDLYEALTGINVWEVKDEYNK